MKSMFVLSIIFIIVSFLSQPCWSQNSKITRETKTAVNRFQSMPMIMRQGEALDLLGADRTEHDAREQDA